jgi:hypothetical protein
MTMGLGEMRSADMVREIMYYDAGDSTSGRGAKGDTSSSGSDADQLMMLMGSGVTFQTKVVEAVNAGGERVPHVAITVTIQSKLDSAGGHFQLVLGLLLLLLLLLLLPLLLLPQLA